MDANDETSAEKLIEALMAGELIDCPVCGHNLETIPSEIKPGKRPFGVVCSKDHRHFTIYQEPADAMSSARRALKNIVKG